MAAQASESARRVVADWVIVNDGDLAALRAQADASDLLVIGTIPAGLRSQAARLATSPSARAADSG